MGRVTNQITGTARGKVGNLVYRAKKSGESTVYPLNTERKKPDTPLAIAHNNRFKTIVKFAAAVNDSVFLRDIWRTFRNIKGDNAYNKIHSFNYQHSHSDFMDKSAMIVPKGINMEILDFVPKEDYFTIKFLPTEELLLHFKHPCVAVIIICLSSPSSNRKGQKVLEHNKYLTFETEIDECIFTAGKAARIKSKQYKGSFKIIDDYRRVRVYLSLVFDSVSGKRMCTLSTSYLYKGVELDFQHDELIQKRFKERQKKLNEPKGKYSELRLR